MTPALAAASQSFSPGILIELFILDLNPINVATVYYFTTTRIDGYTVVFNGHTYTYAPIGMTGISWSANGDPPNPKVMLPNADKFTSALILQYEDLIGAQLTRMRTYKQFLDGESLADPTAYIAKDIFTVEQKTALNRAYAEFGLRPVYSLDTKYLPGRTCVKDLCTQRYRIWDGSSFDYSKATCPYVAATYFKKDGSATAVAAEDVCGKRLSDCTARFGATNELPTRAFPGMSRIRIA